MKILLVEDNTLLAKSISKGLKEKKIFVEHFSCGKEALNYFLENYSGIDLVVLDLMLPNKSGEEICREIRQKGIKTPILILSAKSKTENKVDLLLSGADDFLAKPFSFEELYARIMALTRRKGKEFQDKKIFLSEDVFLDPYSRAVFKNSKEIHLSPKEFTLLEFFAQNPNRAFSRREIFNQINDFADSPWSNSVDVYIKNLRKKLFYDQTDPIKTIYGFGYKFQKEG